MLNLLFISDSPKAEYIKSVLQPMLKVIIDVVADFDHGLKDVFEKRPATICIQDQINGVTGESVARHIQMLLGNSAPKFIFLHTGAGKERAIKGLYEHLVDLSQPDDVAAEDMKNALMSLLGDQWKKIYIPPALSPASVRSSVAVPEESREDADKLVDDFLTDLEMSSISNTDVQPPVTPVLTTPMVEPFVAAQSEAPPKTGEVLVGNEPELFESSSDELAQLLLDEVNKEWRNDIPTAVPSAAAMETGVVFNGSPKPEATEKLSHLGTAGQAAAPGSEPRKTPLAASAVSAPGKNPIATASASPITPASEFRISQNVSPDEEPVSEDLLQAFEDNYRSESRFLRSSIAIVFVCIVAVAGGWYLITHNPHMVSSLKQRFLSSSSAKQIPIMAPAVPPVQMPLSPPLPQAAVTPPLPAFISKAVRDTSYSVKNPGWERYVGKQAEFRVFSAAGRIQAIQILAVKAAPISEALIKSMLQEFIGSSEYTINSRSIKSGVQIATGRIQDKGEIMIYRKNGAVKALVISVK